MVIQSSEALDQILTHSEKFILPIERLKLKNAFGRVLSEEVSFITHFLVKANAWAVLPVADGFVSKNAMRDIILFDGRNI